MPYETYLLANYATNLRAYWPLGETSGSVIDDAGSNAYDGAVVGSLTFSRPGIPGSNYFALGTGNGNYIRLEGAGQSARLRVANWTLGIWFKSTGTHGTTTTAGDGTGFPTGDPIVPIITKGRGESETAGLNLNWLLGLNGAGPKLAGDFESTTGPNHRIVGVTDVTANEWHFGVLAYDGSALKLYLDGALETTVNTTDVADNTSTQFAAIATALTSAAAAQGYFAGDVAHASLWSAALALADIQNLFAEGKPSTPEAALVTTTPTLPTSTIVIQLSDDSSTIDDSSVTGADVVLKRNGVTLAEGVSYSFSYNSSNDRITLTALPGGSTFPVGSYTVTLN